MNTFLRRLVRKRYFIPPFLSGNYIFCACRNMLFLDSYSVLFCLNSPLFFIYRTLLLPIFSFSFPFFAPFSSCFLYIFPFFSFPSPIFFFPGERSQPRSLGGGGIWKGDEKKGKELKEKGEKGKEKKKEGSKKERWK